MRVSISLWSTSLSVLNWLSLACVEFYTVNCSSSSSVSSAFRAPSVVPPVGLFMIFPVASFVMLRVAPLVVLLVVIPVVLHLSSLSSLLSLLPLSSSWFLHQLLSTYTYCIKLLALPLACQQAWYIAVGMGDLAAMTKEFNTIQLYCWSRNGRIYIEIALCAAIST